MAGILPGTTPYLTTTVEDCDLTGAQNIVFTIKNMGRLYNFSGDRVTAAKDGDDTVLIVHLTRDESLKLHGRTASLQVQWKDALGEVYGTEPDCEIPLEEVYYRGEI